MSLRGRSTSSGCGASSTVRLDPRSRPAVRGRCRDASAGGGAAAGGAAAGGAAARRAGAAAAGGAAAGGGPGGHRSASTFRGAPPISSRSARPTDVTRAVDVPPSAALAADRHAVLQREMRVWLRRRRRRIGLQQRADRRRRGRVRPPTALRPALRNGADEREVQVRRRRRVGLTHQLADRRRLVLRLRGRRLGRRLAE